MTFPFTQIDNKEGKKLVRFDCTINAQRRPTASESSKGAPKKESQDNSNVKEGQDIEGDHVAGQPGNNPGDGMVRDTWRLISAVQAWPTSHFFLPQLVDYGHDNGKVLKSAIPLINQNRPDLMWDHSSSSKDVAGHVENASWEASVDIPPGVNAHLVVDPDWDRKAADGLRKGHLRNGSIGVTMDCVPSHPDMPWEQFFEMQGREVDGEVVRWLPERIEAVRHMALVPAGAGADPNAGRRSPAGDHTSGAPAKQTKEVKVNMKKPFEVLQEILNKMGIDMMVVEESEFSDASAQRIYERVDQMAGVGSRYNELAAACQEFGKRLTNEGESITALQAAHKVHDLFELAECGKRLVEFKAKEALEWFDKAKFSPEKTDLSESEKRIRTRIESSRDLDYIEDMIAEYRSLAEMKFPDARRSSKEQELPEDGSGERRANPDISASSARLFG